MCGVSFQPHNAHYQYQPRGTQQPDMLSGQSTTSTHHYFTHARYFIGGQLFTAAKHMTASLSIIVLMCLAVAALSGCVRLPAACLCRLGSSGWFGCGGELAVDIRHVRAG